MTTYGYQDFMNIIALTDQVFNTYKATQNCAVTGDFVDFMTGLQCFDDWYSAVVAQSPPLTDVANRLTLMQTIRDNYIAVEQYINYNA